MGQLSGLLIAKREELGKTLADAAKYTSIRIAYLEYLEKGEYEKLPSYVHVHGFLAQYSKYLGLDFAAEVKPLLNEECKKESFGKTPEEIKAADASQDAPFYISGIQIVAGTVLAVILILAFVFFRASDISSKRTAARNAAEANEERARRSAYESGGISEQAAGAQQPYTEQVSPLNETAQAAAESERTALLHFSADCWIQYRIDSSIGGFSEFTAPANTEYVVTFKKFFQLNVGNAGGLSVIYNGKTYSDFGALNAAIFNLYFTANDDGNLQRSRTPPIL